MDESFFDQMSLMPPVDSARWDTWPLVMVLSTSARKEAAMSCFCALNALRRAIAALSGFVGILVGLFRGELHGVASPSLSSSEMERFPRFVAGVLRGEYWSFQPLITSWLQKASILGRWGVGGIRIFLDGDCNRDLNGLAGGVMFG